MRKITIIFILVFSAMFAKAQGPSMSVDSLERFINRYIRNVAVESFTNLRMNTVLINLTRYVDSALGAGTLDTSYVVGDSLKIITNIKTFSVFIGGNDSLFVNNKGTSGVRMAYVSGDSINISKLINDDGSINWSKNADSSANAKLNRTPGYLDIKNGAVASRTTSFKSYTDMRALATANLDTSYIYYFQNGGRLLPYRYSSTDVTSADDTMTTIVTGAGARLKLIYSSTLTATDFGAVPNDGNSDSYQIQKYINWAIANSQFPVVNLQGGVYEVQNLRIMWDNNADGNWDFITLTLNGATPTYAVSTSLGQTTIFNVTDQDGFGIAVQAGRNVYINNISIKSGAPVPGSVKDMIEWTDAQWLGTYRNNSFSPHAGIVIDPFHSTVTGGNRYPNSTAYYTNSNAAASSMVTMQGVTIYGFVVGVMQNPNASSLNGDNIVMRDSHIEGCRSAWACGQNQSRANYVENLYITGLCKYGVNATEYGSGIGSAPTFTNLNVGGNGIKYLYRLTGGFSGITFSQGYCENVFSLGTSSSYMPITFENMQIKFADPTAAGTFSSPVIAEGGKLNFIGGSLRWFNNDKPAALNFNVDQLSFIGTHIQGAIPENRATGAAYKEQKTGFFDTYLQAYGARIGDNTNFTKNDLSNINRLYAITGNTYKPTLAAGLDLEFKITGPKVDRIYIESKTVDIDTVNNVIKIITPANKTAYQVNDFISIDQSISSSITEYASAPGHLGFVSAITADTVFVQYFPYGLNESTTYDLYIARPAKLVMPTLGDLTSGSPTVNNVLSNGGTFVAGDYVKGNGIPVGTRIASVGSGTFTLTRNATATVSKVELYDQLYDMTATGYDTTVFNNYIFFHNHKIINSNDVASTDTIQAWVCTTPGKIGGTSVQHPTFKLVKYNALLTVSGGGSDHNALSNLTVGDVHTQYAFLNGRSGGQTFKGGTGVTDALNLYGTSGNGTAGSIAIQAGVGNNGATKAITILNNGQVGVNRTSTGGYNFVVEGVGGFSNGANSWTYEGTYFNIANGSNNFTQRITAYGKRFDIGLDNSKFYIQPQIDNTIPFAIRSTTADVIGIDFSVPKVTITGALSLKGIEAAPGTFNVLVKSLASDSNAYQVPVSSLTIEGTYTPTLTSVSNITGTPTVTTCYYSVSGTTVTVWGEITFDPTTTLTATELAISLPPSYISAISNAYELVGSATSDSINEAMNIKGDAANDRAVLKCTPIDVAVRTASFSLRYKYIAP